MHLDPMCIKNKHKCKQVCVGVMCRSSNPFVCETCNNKHDKQSCQVMPFKKLVKQFHKIQGLYTNQILKYEERVETTFSQLIKGLQAQFIKFREEFEYTNINQKIANIYNSIRDNQQNKLTGQTIHWAMRTQRKKGTGLKIKDELSMRLLKQNIVDIYTEVINRLPPYYSLKHLQQAQTEFDGPNQLKLIQQGYVGKRKMASGLMGNYFGYFEKMIKKEIYNIHLLYRATENNFSAAAFHKKCDGMSNTVMIAKTQHDKIVIGYCPFSWESPKDWVYKEDNKQQCFLISPAKQLKDRRFTPFKTKFAIGMHKDYGPSFGDDFVIYDKAHNSKNCWSNFPDVYTCKTKPLNHTAETINCFVGVKDHFQKFNLKQWEVYKISYGKDEQLQSSFVKQYNLISKY